jgi:hypothetical protein
MHSTVSTTTSKLQPATDHPVRLIGGNRCYFFLSVLYCLQFVSTDMCFRGRPSRICWTKKSGTDGCLFCLVGAVLSAVRVHRHHVLYRERPLSTSCLLWFDMWQCCGTNKMRVVDILTQPRD